MFEKEVFKKIKEYESESHVLMPYYDKINLYLFHVDVDKLKQLLDAYYKPYKIDKNSYKVLDTWIEISDNEVKIFAR
jgi:hypothetical protein